MGNYNLKWKNKGERGYWNTSIYAENNEEAIEKANDVLSIENVEKAKLEILKYSYKTIAILK